MHLGRYRRVVEQRNALLHLLRTEGRGRGALPGFTEELVGHGSQIVVARMQLVAALQPLAADALHRVSGGAERLELRYVSNTGAESPDAAVVADAMMEALRRAADEEARGVTLVGPHRDDVEIDLDGRPARHTASQGQQRSIVLACKLAEMRHVADVTGHTPVVLLDDVLSELDPRRRRDLVAALADGAGQVLVTTTEPLPDVALFASARHFTVQRGVVAESAD
jgi:DNA replication and repair protein RecF